jgi:hypothetical protein
MHAINPKFCSLQTLPNSITTSNMTPVHPDTIIHSKLWADYDYTHPRKAEKQAKKTNEWMDE